MRAFRSHSTRSHVAHPRFSHPIAVSAYGAAPEETPTVLVAGAALAGAAISGAVQGVIFAYFLDVPVARGAKVGAAINLTLGAIGVGLKGIASSLAVRPTSATEIPT